MISSEIIAGVIIALFLMYFILGLMAYSSIERKQDTWLISFPLWFLHKNIYNNFGKRLCPIGKGLFTVILIVTIFWAALF